MAMRIENDLLIIGKRDNYITGIPDSDVQKCRRLRTSLARANTETTNFYTNDKVEIRDDIIRWFDFENSKKFIIEYRKMVEYLEGVIKYVLPKNNLFFGNFERKEGDETISFLQDAFSLIQKNGDFEIPRPRIDFRYLKLENNNQNVKILKNLIIGSLSVLFIQKGSDGNYKIWLELVPNVLQKLGISNVEEEIIQGNTLDHINSSKDLKATNIIFYGVPGSGKSYHLKQLVDQRVDERYYERTVLHSDYSYTDFVGQIMPIVDDSNNVTYKFVPNIFTKMLEKAINDKENDYFLIIEEINRGNAAAIFGDLFQLLDRKDYESEYRITNYEIQKYLFNQGVTSSIDEKIFIPKNLYIYATMNTSDQGVYTLDTAFKRRWLFKLVPNNMEVCSYANYYVPNSNLTWKEFHSQINKKIINDQLMNSSFEDKQIGPFFISPLELCVFSKEVNPELNSDLELSKRFAYKIIEYLWNDVAKLNRHSWFGERKTLEDAIEYYLNNGVGVITGVRE